MKQSFRDGMAIFGPKTLSMVTQTTNSALKLYVFIKIHLEWRKYDGPQWGGVEEHREQRRVKVPA